MNLFADLFNFILSAQSDGFLDPAFDFQSCGRDCPASAFNAVTAAFSTLGYYAQAEWLFLIHNGGLGTWAVVAYMFAAVGVIISMAMGMPPRMYLWLAVGPAVFFWLTDARTPVKGVAWRVGVSADDEEMSPRPMQEVWKLAEVGLLNDNYIIRNGMRPKSDGPPDSGNGVDECSEAACVSTFFAMVDHLVSDTIQQLVWILGVSRANPASPGENSNVFSDISDVDIDDSLRMWDLTTNLKWEFVQSITSARVANNDVRQLFSQFMASECGTKFMDSIDKKEMAAATYSRGTDIDGHVLLLKDNSGFIGPISPGGSGGRLFMGNFSCGGPTPGTIGPSIISNSYEGPAFSLINTLEPESIPTPKALRKIGLQNKDGAIGAESGISEYRDLLIQELDANPTEVADIRETINCRTYLTMLMQGLRWEASQITYQLLRSAPQGMLPGAYAGQMLYGWDIEDTETGSKIGIGDAPKFLENLILIHLFRNELQIAPSQITEQRLTGGQKTVKSTQDFQRVNGQVSKYGELYTWALMVPYFQGKLLYFLAIAYPFAAILVIVPGMHTAMMQWIQFWVWVKLWDLGFAMVTILERSVWAMTSNTLASGHINESVFAIKKLNPTCIVPGFFDHDMVTTYIPTVSMPVLEGDAMAALIDRLLKLSNNIDLDMSNTYYVYIMSALYFAIPAVTGQLVLGAKSGAAGMISSAIGQIASSAGSAAGQAAAADIGAKMKMAQAVGRQEAFASALRGGLAAAALGKQNESAARNIESTAASTKGNLFGTLGQAENAAASLNRSGMGLNKSAATLAGSLAGMLPDFVTGSAVGGGAFSAIGANTGGFLVDGHAHTRAIDYNRAAMGHTRGQIGATQDGFNKQAQGTIANLEGNRAEAKASFAAEQAAWESANNYAQGNSEFAAAIGLGAGYLDAGQRPTNMQGMAMDGMLGAEAKSAGSDLTFDNNGQRSSVGGIYDYNKGGVEGLGGAATARTLAPDMSYNPGVNPHDPQVPMPDTIGGFTSQIKDFNAKNTGSLKDE